MFVTRGAAAPQDFGRSQPHGRHPSLRLPPWAAVTPLLNFTEPEHTRCVPALVYPAGSCDAWSVLGTARRPPEPNPAAEALTFPSLHPGIPHSYQFSSRTSTAPAWGSERLNLSFLLFKKWFFLMRHISMPSTLRKACVGLGSGRDWKDSSSAAVTKSLLEM